MRRGGLVPVVVLAVVALLSGACASEVEDNRLPVTVFAPYRDVEAERFMADLSQWASEHGILIRYTGSGNLAADLQHRVDNADPPDIALVPQPGLVASFFREGQVRALSPAVDAVATEHDLPEALDLGRIDGTQVGFPFRINVKSLVWYRPATFASLGLEPPATLDDLDRLVVDIEAAGATPWCMGIAAEGATGWVATDWVEDLIVRDWGIEVYQDWIAGTVPFGDPRIESSFDAFRTLVLAPRRVVGGLNKVLSTPVAEGGTPLFAQPPGCVLYHQASFAISSMPPGTTVGPTGDVNVFVLPGASAGAVPIEVGVDLAVAFADRPEVDEVMAYLASPPAVETWTTAGGFLSPFDDVAAERFAQPSDRQMVGILAEADDLVIDASDAMPPEIGTGLFWTQITLWLANAITYDELAETIDAARAP